MVVPAKYSFGIFLAVGSLHYHEHLCKNVGSLSRKPHLGIEETIFPGISFHAVLKTAKTTHFDILLLLLQYLGKLIVILTAYNNNVMK